MKLLVLGKTGQVAQSLLSRQGVGDCQFVARGRPDVDLTDKATIATAMDQVEPDVVVNAAAYTTVDKAETEPDQAMAVNAMGAEHIARLCATAARPLIHLSTDYVFNGEKSGPYVETDPTAPLGVYGKSKLEGEKRIADHLDQHIIVRTAWVYSPYGNNFVKTMLRLAKDRDVISVVNDQVGSPTYAPHLADAIVQIASDIMQKTSVPWGVYHGAGSGYASWYEVAKKIFSDSGRLGEATANVEPIPTSAYPTPAQRPKNSTLDCTRLAQDFSINLPDWELGIEACLKQLFGNDTADKQPAPFNGGQS